MYNITCKALDFFGVLLGQDDPAAPEIKPALAIWFVRDVQHWFHTLARFCHASRSLGSIMLAAAYGAFVLAASMAYTPRPPFRDIQTFAK